MWSIEALKFLVITMCACNIVTCSILIGFAGHFISTSEPYSNLFQEPVDDLPLTAICLAALVVLLAIICIIGAIKENRFVLYVVCAGPRASGLETAERRAADARACVTGHGHAVRRGGSRSRAAVRVPRSLHRRQKPARAETAAEEEVPIPRTHLRAAEPSVLRLQRPHGLRAQEDSQELLQGKARRVPKGLPALVLAGLRAGAGRRAVARGEDRGVAVLLPPAARGAALGALGHTSASGWPSPAA